VVHKNYVILLSALENYVFPIFVPYSTLIRLRPIGAGSLTFGQTSQLRLEIKVIGSICHRNYVIPLSALENHVFIMFKAYSAIYGLVKANRGWKIDFWSNFQLRLE